MEQVPAAPDDVQSVMHTEPWVVSDIGQVRVIDTRALPWTAPPPGAPFHGTSTKTRVLARTTSGWPIVQMLSRPAGSSSSQSHGRAERHFHRTVREWVYIFSGQLSYREFQDDQDVHGTRIAYLEGFFLDRHPGPRTWHGLDPDGGSEGYVGLEFRSGAGLGSDESGHAEETVSIADEDVLTAVSNSVVSPSESSSGFSTTYPHDDALVYSTPQVRLIDSRAVPWTRVDSHRMSPHGAVHVRPLSDDEDGSVTFEQVHLRADPGGPSGLYRISRCETWMVLSGDCAIEVDGQPVELKAGYFVDWTAGSSFRFRRESLTVGVQLLVARCF